MSHKILIQKQKNKKLGFTFMIVIAIGLFVLNLELIHYSMKTAVMTAQDAYGQTFEEQSSETYEMYYQMSYDRAEKKSHVSNRTTIDVQSVKETSSLEVLQVSDVVYIYDENDTRSWTAVFGYGVYTVDLLHSEILVDNERQSVLIRIPRPRLNREGLDYKSIRYVFKDGVFNGSISDGVNAARDDLRKAYNKLQEEMESSQLYYAAEKSAKELITSMVKGLNQEFPDLIVEVELMD